MRYGQFREKILIQAERDNFFMANFNRISKTTRKIFLLCFLGNLPKLLEHVLRNTKKKLLKQI